MSIRSFIETTKILYKDKKYEEALCLACNAVDACAAKKYPDIKQNNERYKLFLKENFSVICHYGFPGVEASSILIKVDNPISELKTDKDGYVNMEQIIYHILRCGLTHECSVGDVIEFTDNTIIQNWEEKFYIPKDIILGLIKIVEMYER